MGKFKVKRWIRKHHHWLHPWSGGPLRDKSLRKKLGLTGKQVKAKLMPQASSASSYYGDLHGPTGSIVGRY